MLPDEGLACLVDVIPEWTGVRSWQRIRRGDGDVGIKTKMIAGR